MPLDNIQKAKSKGLLQTQRQNSAGMITSRYDSDTEGQLTAPFRSKLHHLFGQIEKEFETLYTENLHLQDKVETLQERLDAYMAVDKSINEPLETVDGATKAKRSASHISQKIKKSYIASTSRLVSSFRQTAPAYTVVKSFHGHKDGVWEVNTSKLNPQIIGTASADHSARIWNVETGLCLLQYLGHSGSVNAIRFNPVKDGVVTTSGEGTAHIWSPQVSISSMDALRAQSSEDYLDMSDQCETNEENPDQPTTLRTPLRELIGHHSVVIAADWLNFGGQAITASWDRTAILFDAETGANLTVLKGHDQELTDVRAHPSQDLVVTSSKDTTFRLWDFRDPNMPVTVFQGHNQPVTTAAFAGNEKVVSGSDDRTVKVWDLKNMRSPIATIRTDSSVNRLCVSQSQNMIAIPHDNRHIRLFDINGNRIGRLPRSSRTGHSKMVCSVACAEDNPVCNLFSCGFDRQVLGWSINVQIKE
ncbi:WD repeat-containing protein 37-like isoform X4 [Dreissena polymorpha]|uniref:WD repeat-containing protein 37-like isoform X4 n=1 Tax=Dreissena polymorpha TaxID=45954 RepID=UPI002264054F|nr:WD repeat-containing protein 37-like isoform X4 [Dreissena polymorpha]